MWTHNLCAGCGARIYIRQNERYLFKVRYCVDCYDDLIHSPTLKPSTKQTFRKMLAGRPGDLGTPPVVLRPLRRNRRGVGSVPASGNIS